MSLSFNLEQISLYDSFKQELQVGDILLTQTNSLLYATGRSILKVNYDHVSVLVEQEKLIHISWPKVRIIHPLQLVSGANEVKIIRPRMKPQEVAQFVRYLTSSLDSSYDLMGFARGVWRRFFQEWFVDQKVLEDMISNSELCVKKKQVCTDLVFYSLIASSAEFRSILKEKIFLLDFPIIGAFTPNDFDCLLHISDYFTLVTKVTLSQSKFSVTLKTKLKGYLEELQQFEKFLPTFKFPTFKAKFDIYDAIEQVLTMLELFQLLSLPKETLIKRVLAILSKRAGFNGKQKHADHAYHVVSILLLFVQPKSIKNGMKMINHLLHLSSESQPVHLKQMLRMANRRRSQAKL